MRRSLGKEHRDVELALCLRRARPGKRPGKSEDLRLSLAPQEANPVRRNYAMGDQMDDSRLGNGKAEAHMHHEKIGKSSSTLPLIFR